MTPAGLVVDGVSVRYGSIRAVQGASLELPAGIVALVGSNGAGKSSLVKAIAGLERTVEGSVRTRDGRDLTHMPAHRRVRDLGIVLVPEGRGVLPSMTVAENLEFGLRIGALRAARERRSEEGLTRAGLFELFPQLQDRYRVQARYLSGGEQQMLSIARALAMAPKFLLVDEPSLGLSPAIVASLFNTIKRVVVEREIALLLIEQDTRAALSLSDYAYVMERGRIELEGPSREIADGPLLRAAYLGAHEVIAR
jgi:branched-chain amino acid transport system ATP-binding protein